MSANALIGTGWAFPPQFRAPSVGPEMLADEQLIQQSIYILLNSQIGERLFKPGFGCGLQQFLFHAPTGETLADIKEEITKAIAQNEARIRLQTISFDSSDLYEGLLNIELEYLIKQTNSIGNMVFPFYLSEG
ncbi:GPW/gp25 family protein [Shewanella sp. VB17]|uniref:GPW/gp25 family protein n=1 Tax=Shewanella sp. VB17 TaxID=2739432 RepID=UPI0015672CEE|nr:GPW/gp25 family protein [Shewanella sp. VB17]NRD73493.1 GPW/gp25 family protein [Shewanella sp. VB17]